MRYFIYFSIGFIVAVVVFWILAKKTDEDAETILVFSLLGWIGWPLAVICILLAPVGLILLKIVETILKKLRS